MGTESNTSRKSDHAIGWLAGDGQRDLVSIVVPTFNRATLVLELLENLSQQTWKHLQIIVVDDGSTDDTAARIENWKSSHRDVRLLYLKKAQGGASSARNVGLLHCNGEFIYFIDSDDLIFPHALENMINEIRSSGIPFCVATISTAGRDGVFQRLAKEYAPYLNKNVIFRNGWATHGALFCRHVIRDAGPHNETLLGAEDLELRWRIISVSGQPANLEQTIGIQRFHDSGHLWQDISDEQKDEALMKAIRVYMQWSQKQKYHPESVSRGLLMHGSIMAIKFGARSDWKHKDQAVELLALSKVHYPLLCRAMMGLFSPRLRSIFVCLSGIHRLGRSGKHFIKSWTPNSNAPPSN
jgi:glycosyltransferase involved in cell wall biosynthesis